MGIDLFEQAADAGGRILRVEQLVAADGDGDPQRGPGYLLTFDVGRILVAADPKHEQLLLRHVEDASEVSALRLASLDEEEPWWKVAGNPITRVWPAADGGEGAVAADAVHGVRLQFRADDENPKVISMVYEGGAVRVGEEPANGG